MPRPQRRLKGKIAAANVPAGQIRLDAAAAWPPGVPPLRYPTMRQPAQLSVCLWKKPSMALSKADSLLYFGGSSVTWRVTSTPLRCTTTGTVSPPWCFRRALSKSSRPVTALSPSRTIKSPA